MLLTKVEKMYNDNEHGNIFFKVCYTHLHQNYVYLYAFYVLFGVIYLLGILAL